MNCATCRMTIKPGNYYIHEDLCFCDDECLKEYLFDNAIISMGFMDDLKADMDDAREKAIREGVLC